MSDPISTNPCSHLAQIFSTEQSHDLGQHHNGQKILCDCDGPGVFHIVFPKKNFTILTDNPTHDPSKNTFQDFLIITSKIQQEFFISTLTGPQFEPKTLTPTSKNQSQHHGPCWILPPSGPFIADDVHDRITLPPNSLPYPVFHNVSGENLNLLPYPDLTSKVTPILNFKDPNSFPNHDWKVINISETKTLSSTFPDQTPFTSPKACHLNRASFTIPINPQHQNLILRKTYDRFHGRQRARVLINNTFAGWWYLPQQNRTHRWAVAHFPLPPNLTQNHSEITITIDPPAAVPLWDFASYDLITVTNKVPSPIPIK